MDLDHYDPNKDVPPTREFPLTNGNTLRAKRLDPYGFWKLSLEQGQLPEEFQGDYTSIEQVQLAVNRYIDLRKNVEVGEPAPRPEIKFKKVPTKEN